MSVAPHSYVEAFERTFERVRPFCRNILTSHLEIEEKTLSDLVRVVCRNGPTEYPFIARYAYQISGGRFEGIIRFAAVVHILQTSTFLIDDVLDRSAIREGEDTLYAS